jgi:hypothetical protein
MRTMDWLEPMNPLKKEEEGDKKKMKKEEEKGRIGSVNQVLSEKEVWLRSKYKRELTGWTGKLTQKIHPAYTRRTTLGPR